MTIVEQVARELCRWEGTEDMAEWEIENLIRLCRREARKLVKMVCGSCGLAKPLMSKEGVHDAR